MVLKYIPLIAACLTGVSTAADQTAPVEAPIELPELGAPSDRILTPAEEKRIGKAFMKNVRKSQTIIDDPLVAEYVQDLGRRLLKQSAASGEDFHFFVIDEPVINAFAGPGGHIGVFTGLILATQNESELASVVAHEIAHVTQKHLLRAFDTASQLSGQTAALLLAAILVGATASPDAGIALAASAQASAIQEQINFTRSNEQEADHVGIQILNEAEYDPRSMAVFFERLTHANRLFDTGIPELLRTHPVTTNRIADALGRAEQYPYKQYESSLRFYLIREKLRAFRFEAPRDAVAHFESGLADGRHLNREAHEYGHVIALTRDGQYKKARKLIDELVKLRPLQVEYQIAAAEIEKLDGHIDKALEILDLAGTLMPNDYALSVTHVEYLLHAKKAEQAKQIASNIRQLRPNDPRLFRLLSEAEEQLGNQTESHRLLAEAFIVDGDLHAAVQQLKIAKKQDKDIDFYTASRIDSRIKQLEQAIAAEKKDS